MSRGFDYEGLFVFEKKGKVILCWRAHREELGSFFCVESRDGSIFKDPATATALADRHGKKIHVPRHIRLAVSSFEDDTFLAYVNAAGEVVIAKEGRGGVWKTVTETGILPGPAVFVAIPGNRRQKRSFIAFASIPREGIGRFRGNDHLTHWREEDLALHSRHGLFDERELTPLHTALVKQGLLLVYSARDKHGRLTVGAVLFDPTDPARVLWRAHTPLWRSHEGEEDHAVFLGGANIGKYFYIYLRTPSGRLLVYPVARYWEAPAGRFKLPRPLARGGKTLKLLALERYAGNPVIEPIPENEWEAFATFNPAAIELGGKIHLLYRAQGHDGLSVLGYASSHDGIRIDERLSEPVFVPSRPFDTRTAEADWHPYPYASGGGWGGCEDPRLTALDDTLYLTYVAFNGGSPPGVALSSITRDDFMAKRWRWKRPKLISRPGQIQKNWVIFPEKVGGRYAVLHGISPAIQIEYVDDLDELGDGRYIDSLRSHGGGGYVEKGREKDWDNIVRGAGAPPLKTDRGWLVFYHAMDRHDPGRYKVGAMLLDLEDPEKVICRAKEPVLEPDMTYENDGHKSGVVYVCGVVAKDDLLLVYYGASDRTVAVASTSLKDFLDQLVAGGAPSLQTVGVSREASASTQAR